MTLDSSINTKVNLQSEYQNSLINDSVFFNSSISVDVICLVSLIVVILLSVGLFLRLSKRLSLVESEIIVILRALRRSRAFTDESQCWIEPDKNRQFDGTQPENLLLKQTGANYLTELYRQKLSLVHPFPLNSIIILRESFKWLHKEHSCKVMTSNVPANSSLAEIWTSVLTLDFC